MLVNTCITCFPKGMLSPLLYALVTHAVVYTYPEVIEGPADVSAKATQNVQFKCEFEAPTATGVSIVVWLKDDFAVIQSSSHYNISMNPSVTDDGVGENTDHFISTLSILGVTNKDAGKYSCYCYYNTTMVTSTKSQYVISNVKSANLQIKSDDNKKSLSYTQLYAAVSAGTVVFIVLMTVWIISAIVYLRYRKRPQLVNLQEGYYDGDEYDEKQSLIQAAQGRMMDAHTIYCYCLMVKKSHKSFCDCKSFIANIFYQLYIKWPV